MPPEQLLALQLHARGYSVAEIAELVGRSPKGVALLLELAASHLGAADAAGAIRAARCRGLIV